MKQGKPRYYYTPERVRKLLKGYMLLIEGDFPWEPSGLPAPHYDTPHTYINSVMEVKADIDRALEDIGGMNALVMVSSYILGWADDWIGKVIGKHSEAVRKRRERNPARMATFLGWQEEISPEK